MCRLSVIVILDCKFKTAKRHLITSGVFLYIFQRLKVEEDMRNIYEFGELGKYKDLLVRIKEERIFSIYNCGNKFYISEECDNYFSHELTTKNAKSYQGYLMN